jgi:hypothetical protein
VVIDFSFSLEWVEITASRQNASYNMRMIEKAVGVI